MKVSINRITIDHLFFCYLTPEEKDEIRARQKSGMSHILCFEEDEGEPVFAAVIDLDAGACLHVRECGGHFPRHYKVLDSFTAALAKAIKKSFVSLKTKIDGVDILATKAGFSKDETGDWVKAVA